MDRSSQPLIATWVRVVIVIACAITYLIVQIGPGMVSVDLDNADRFLFNNALPMGLFACFAFVLVWLGETSCWLRLAILLPLIHLACIVVAYVVWHGLDEPLRWAHERVPLVDELRIEMVIGGLAIATVGGARLVVARRKREWLHVAVVVALANLMLVGLWLPIATRIVSSTSVDTALVAIVLVPPFACALGFAALVHRRPQDIRPLRVPVTMLLAVAYVFALACRGDAASDGAELYLNFIHVLLALVIVAVGTLVALAFAIGVRVRRVRRWLAGDPLRRTGTIVFDGDAVVARYQITSWLRGPRSVVRPIAIATASGELAVPSGVELAVPIPEATIGLCAGEHVDVLLTGSRVVLAGYVALADGHPFRDSSALIPGPRGIVVGDDTDTPAFAQIALSIWRPSVAYLLILAAVGLSTLVSG